jgi:hypothetical protein
MVSSSSLFRSTNYHPLLLTSSFGVSFSSVSSDVSSVYGRFLLSSDAPPSTSTSFHLLRPLDPYQVKRFRAAKRKAVRPKISKTEWERSRRFVLSEEAMLIHRNRVCIPAGHIRQDVLREVHDTMVGGYIGPAKMHVRLTQVGLYWRRMKADCRRYTKGCSTFLGVKPSNQKPMGLLHQLTIPEARWERIGVDFITDLPPSGDAGYDAIMSVIDRGAFHSHKAPGASPYLVIAPKTRSRPSRKYPFLPYASLTSSALSW